MYVPKAQDIPQDITLISTRYHMIWEGQMCVGYGSRYSEVDLDPVKEKGNTTKVEQV